MWLQVLQDNDATTFVFGVIDKITGVFGPST